MEHANILSVEKRESTPSNTSDRDTPMLKNGNDRNDAEALRQIITANDEALKRMREEIQRLKARLKSLEEKKGMSMGSREA